MLPHYSPLKVAETFSMLSGLYPERIDLGIGRAPGTDPETMFVLQRDRRQRAPDDFREQLEELLGYIDDSFPAGHPLARLAALPGGPGTPDVWLLGSSPDSAMWASEFGLPYCFADFINPRGARIAELYRERYSASDRSSASHVAAGVAVICAESDEEALRLAASQQMAFALLHVGRLIPVPPVEKALRFLEGQPAPSLLRRDRRVVVGSPETVRAGLEEVATEYGAGEILVVTITHDHGARRRSYELIAEAFELAARAELAGAATSSGTPQP
jgi:luciferase family oxidoreductase group 1